jgi:hypothetical protein
MFICKLICKTFHAYKWEKGKLIASGYQGIR